MLKQIFPRAASKANDINKGIKDKLSSVTNFAYKLLESRGVIDNTDLPPGLVGFGDSFLVKSAVKSLAYDISSQPTSDRVTTMQVLFNKRGLSNSLEKTDNYNQALDLIAIVLNDNQHKKHEEFLSLIEDSFRRYDNLWFDVPYNPKLGLKSPAR